MDKITNHVTPNLSRWKSNMFQFQYIFFKSMLNWQTYVCQTKLMMCDASIPIFAYSTPHGPCLPMVESPCFMLQFSLSNWRIEFKIKTKNHGFFHHFPRKYGGGPGFPVKPLTQPIPILRLPPGSPHVCNWWAAVGPNRLSRPTGRRGPFHGVSSSSRGSPRWPPRRVRLDWIFHLLYVCIYVCIYGVLEFIHENGCVDMCRVWSTCVHGDTYCVWFVFV